MNNNIEYEILETKPQTIINAEEFTVYIEYELYVCPELTRSMIHFYGDQMEPINKKETNTKTNT